MFCSQKTPRHPISRHIKAVQGLPAQQLSLGYTTKAMSPYPTFCHPLDPKQTPVYSVTRFQGTHQAFQEAPFVRFEMKKVESHIAHLKQGQGLGGANRQQLSPENFSINFSPPNPSSSFSLDLGEGFKKIRYGSGTVSTFTSVSVGEPQNWSFSENELRRVRLYHLLR